MKQLKTIDLTHPIVAHELQQTAKFDPQILALLNTLVKTQEAKSGSPINVDVKKLQQDVFYHLTTTRNRNLITKDQQHILRQAVGGFFGMSTGSHSAVTWIMESRAQVIKIVDPDHISPSNLNRMKYGWNAVSKNKVDVVAHEINTISPYTRVIKSLKTDYKSQEIIVNQNPKVDFIVEAVDDLAAKIHLRTFAKKLHVPLIMATDVGDNVFLDIERHDLNPQPKFFNGRVKHIETLDLANITPQERIKISMEIVGFEHNSVAMLASLLSIGKEIPTWPQLASSAALAGGAITAAIKKILLGERVLSGRYYFSLDQMLDADFNSPDNVKKRKALIQQFS